MKNTVTWFELPVKDMARAKQFYQEVMQTEFMDDEMDGFRMAIFNHEPGAASGMLVLGENYEPNDKAAVVYLNGGDDLSDPLGRVEGSGGQIVVPKTALDGGKKGYFAQFLDTEGNRVGLYSLPQALV